MENNNQQPKQLNELNLKELNELKTSMIKAYEVANINYMFIQQNLEILTHRFNEVETRIKELEKETKETN